MHPEISDGIRAAFVARAKLNRDAVADLARGDVRAEPGDDTGRIDARRHRQADAAGVFAGARHGVEGAVDRDGVDLDQHLARPRLRRRHLLELHHVRRAKLADDNRFQLDPPGQIVGDKAAPDGGGQA